MALFSSSTLEHDSVSWIFRQFYPEKRGEYKKRMAIAIERDCGSDSFQIDWKIARGEMRKNINKRKNAKLYDHFIDFIEKCISGYILYILSILAHFDLFKSTLVDSGPH